MIDRVLAEIEASREKTIEELKEFLRIGSVSTAPERAEDCRKCAQWLRGMLESAGLEARVMETGGHPVVLAKNEHREGRATVLVYGHYDVQPPEPLELWETPPFEPMVREEAIYGRGAADDKGQVWAHVAAVAAWEKNGGLPVNLTLLVEGEEEIGSKHLAGFVEKHKEELRADVAVVSDTNQFARGVPAITVGLRGLVYTEVTVKGPSIDLHSGLYGGAVPNPANVLVELLASLHDEQGRVNVPGFYDDVRELSVEERSEWAKLPFDEKAFLGEIGLEQGTGEVGFTTIERKWARPTCDINGLTAGYQGKGAKTVIGALASAKVSMRLVPDQDAKKVAKAFESALRERCPAGVELEVHVHSGTGPVLVPTEGAAMRAAVAAVRMGFGKEPALMREGGSIPVVLMLKAKLGVDTLLVGFGLSDDRVHSPNEKFDLDALYRGTRTCAALYEELGKLKK